MIAVSLNVGGGVRLIKPAKLYMCTQKTTNTTETDARRRVCAAMVPYHSRYHCRTHPAPCVRPRCFCSLLRAHAQFCRFDKADAQPTFSDTAIAASHSDTTIFQLGAHWVRISLSIGMEKIVRTCAPVGVEPSTSCVQGDHPSH